MRSQRGTISKRETFLHAGCKCRQQMWERRSVGLQSAWEKMQEVISSRQSSEQFAVVRVILTHLWLKANNRVTCSTQSSEILPGDEVIFSEIYWHTHTFKAGSWTVSGEVHEIDTPVTSSLVLFGNVFQFLHLFVLNMMLCLESVPLQIFWIRYSPDGWSKWFLKSHRAATCCSEPEFFQGVICHVLLPADTRWQHIFTSVHPPTALAASTVPALSQLVRPSMPEMIDGVMEQAWWLCFHTGRCHDSANMWSKFKGICFDLTLLGFDWLVSWRIEVHMWSQPNGLIHENLKNVLLQTLKRYSKTSSQVAMYALKSGFGHIKLIWLCSKTVFSDNAANVIWCHPPVLLLAWKQTETNAKNAFKAQFTDVCLSHWFSVVLAVLWVWAGHRLHVYCGVFVPSWVERCLCLWVYKHRGSLQTSTLWVTTHCSILSCVCVCTCTRACACSRACVRAWACFPFTGSFVWVSVSSVVCRQAPIVLNHCSLLTQGPWHFVFPWPPSHRRTEGWNWSPRTCGEFVSTPVSLP